MRARTNLVVMSLLMILVVATVLSSCSQPAPTATPTPKPQPTQATSGTQPTAVPQPAGFDWMRFKGQTVNVILNKHPFSESLIANLGGFEEKTGMGVQFEVLSQTEYWQKLRLEMAAGSGAYDVFMCGPSTPWEFVPAGWIEDLTPYINSDEKTDQAWYKFDDFYPKLVQGMQWNGKKGGGMGEGPIWGIPGMVETYILSYRADIFDKWGVKIPTTMQEYYDAAVTLQTKEHAENANFYGVIGRGIPAGDLWSCGYASILKSYSEAPGKAVDFIIDKSTCTFKSVVNHPSLLEPQRLYKEMFAKAGPPGWTSLQWYDVKDGFTNGNFGMVTDCDFFAYAYEDPTKSPIAGKIKYATLPHAPGQSFYSHLWIWSLGMSKHSKKKDQAWLLIQYATGPEQLMVATRDFLNWVPTRKSVFEHPDIKAICEKWGDGTWLPTVQATLNVCAPLNMPQSQGAQTNDIWSREGHEVYKGAKDIKTAMDSAAARMDEAMAKANEKPHPDYCK